ncbi:putative bacterial protein [compost metagenome]
MQSHTQKYLKLFVFVLSLTLPTSLWAQTLEDEFRSNNTAPTFKMTGEVALLSHYVKNGLSQSNKDPALQGSFWFNFGPQFRMGLWGSNVNYEGGNDHFNLNLNADLKIDFSQTTNGILKYSQNQYYKSGDRNGNTLAFHLNFGTYRVTYENESNWEGTDDRSTRFAFGKKSDVFGTWKWDNELGYNTPQVDSITSYFDFRTGLGTKVGNVIFFEGTVTATSSPSQFEGSGDVFLILSASTQF